MHRDVKQYPHRAKEFGYSYPDNPYLTESIAYAKLNASIFCKPRYVPNYNSTGLVAELVDGKLTESQKQTLDTLLSQQSKFKLQLANEVIPFYNRCLPSIEDAFEQDKKALLSFGATSLPNDDVIGLEERLYWEDVHLIAKDGYGDFGMEFTWNLDPEHTITARFKDWQILQLGFTSEIDW